GLLYLVAHGILVDGEPQILLEDEAGAGRWVSGVELAARMAELRDQQRPRLVVLVSCQSAGTGEVELSNQDAGALAGLGPRLAAAGAPAVVAMQGNLTMTTAAAFMPIFLRELRRDGQVDRAMAVARGAVRERPDWWMPVLYTRLQDGRLFDPVDMRPAPACPYPGMVPFRAEDARFFYGREGEIQQMLDHLRHQRLLLVIGPSGSGKSSLIAAGLLPRLEESTYFPSEFWQVRTMRPLDHPVAALAACLEGDVSQPEQSVAALLTAHAPAQRLLLVIDQFEEAFSLADKAERQQFLAALQVLRRSHQCALVIALRADFYPDLMNSELWPVDPSQRLEVAVLRGDALRQAISQPAADVEVQIDEALIERLLADAAGEPGALPMLQETLVLLWERMRRRQITLGDYQQLGDAERSGVAVAVARKADATVAELTPAEQVIAQRIFLRLIQFGEGRRDTRRQLPVADLRSATDDDQAFERTLEHLAHNRLLTLSGEEDDASRRVDISHEALISDWPRLQVWLRERKEAELARRRLEEKVKEWVRLGRKEGGLLDKEELAEAIAWLQTPVSVDLGTSTDLKALVITSKEALHPGWHRMGSLVLMASVISMMGIVVSIFVSLQLATISPASWYAIRLFLGLIAVASLVFTWQIARQDRRFLPRLTHFIAGHRVIQGGVAALSVLAVTMSFSFGLQPLRLANECKAHGYGTNPYNFEVAVVNDNVEPASAELFAWVLEATSKGVLSVHRAIDGDAMPVTCENFLRYRVRLGRHERIATTGTEVVYTAHVLDVQTQMATTYLYAGPEDKCGLILNVANQVAASLNFIRGDFETVDPAVSANTCAAYLTYQDGIRAQQSGQFAEAVQLFEKALASFSGYEQDPVFLIEYARACYVANDLKCAKHTYEALISLTPTDTRVYQNLSVVLRKLGEYTAADSILNQAEAMLLTIPDQAERQYQEYLLRKNRGFLLFDLGQYGAAETLLLQALEMEDTTKGRQSFEEEIAYYLAYISENIHTSTDACTRWMRYMQIGSNGIVGENERSQDAHGHIDSLNCR
ncbi:MAG: CHAT domain-containing protein, partial [Anaerolineae bacterium]